MKFSAIATTLLALTVPSQAALRSSATTKTTKAQVVVHGVKTAFSDEDLAIINQSAISAYNKVQKNSGYVLEDTNTLIHFGVNQKEMKQGCQMCPPDDDSFVADLKQGCQMCPPDDDFLKQGCQMCPPDDDVAAIMDSANALLMEVNIAGLKQGCQMCPPDDDAVALESTGGHKEFVDTFCGLLATSGSTNLMRAHHCSFSFLEEPGHKVTPLTLVKKDESALGFFSVKGLLHDLSVKDIAVIEKAAGSVYNQAYASTGYSVGAIRARGAVETPKSNKNLKQGCQMCPPDDDFLKQGCQMCPPDDDSILNHGVANVVVLDAKVGGLKQGCQMCPPDDDAMAATLESFDMKKINEAFNKALCSKLRNSGSPNLAFADGCAMDFFYEHAEVGEESA